MDHSKLDELSGLPLLPCGAGEKFKAPINPETGRHLDRWQTAAFTPDQLRSMNGSLICIGTRCGPDADNLLILDVDGASAEAFCQDKAGGFAGIGWRINRTTDPHRFKLAFRIDDPELLDLLDGVGKIVHTTSHAPKEQVELFWSTGQCLILGDHRESGGQYEWQGSPLKLKPPTLKWRQLLSELLHSHKKNSRNAKGTTENWIDAIPCPICGRTEPDCRTTDDGTFVQCHKGQRWQPPELQVGATIQRGNDNWAYVGVGNNAIGECANFKLEKPPFRVLGWDDNQSHIYCYQWSTAMIRAIGTKNNNELLQIASKEYWEKNFTNPRGGIDWLSAWDNVFQRANDSRYFNPNRCRGRGFHVDRAPDGWGVVVLHLGNRLVVDGIPTDIQTFQSDFVYEYKSPLPIDLDLHPLSDAEGEHILSVIRRHGWRHSDDYLHLSGWIVCAILGGALKQRPLLQITSHFGSGKTDTLEWIINPLLAGIGQYSRGTTEAGLRQTQRTDTTPVLLDESEQSAGGSKQRDKVLEFCRLAFDGGYQAKGTPTGKAIQYVVRCAVALAGINAEIPNPADRSRFVVVGRKLLDSDEWEALQRERTRVINHEVGQKLLLRVSGCVRCLQRNAKAFTKVLLAAGVADQRTADVHGLVLAGAYLLTSTNRLTEQGAIRWLDSLGYPHEPNIFGATAAPDDEGKQCLDHLLSFQIRWNERPDDDSPTTGFATVLELAGIVHHNRNGQMAARKALGSHGIAHYIKDGQVFLAVQNGGQGIGLIFGRTKWANKAHVQRLREIRHHQPVMASVGSVNFTGVGSHKATLLPWSLLAVIEET